MSNILNLINIVNHLNNQNNLSYILNRTFNEQENILKPCSASFVDKLEKVIITNENVDNNLSCAICQDSFKLGEKVIKLPCKDPHFFHYEANDEDCGGILPWLKEHNSCPICREEFPIEEIMKYLYLMKILMKQQMMMKIMKNNPENKLLKILLKE